MAERFIRSIHYRWPDGILAESIYFTWKQDSSDQIVYETQNQVGTEYLTYYLDIAKNNNKVIFGIDYTDDGSDENDTDVISTRTSSYEANRNLGYLSFQGNFALDKIPVRLNGENSNNILSLSAALNFLYVFSPVGYGVSDGDDFSIRKERIVSLFKQSNYDVIFTNPFYRVIDTEKVIFWDWYNANDSAEAKRKKMAVPVS